MRTKTLLVTAALGAASIATSLAQVYSVNAVGYVNVPVQGGHFYLLNNPLSLGDNTANTILPNGSGLPDGTSISTWDSTKPGTGGLADNADVLVDLGGGSFQWFPGPDPTPIAYPPGRGFLLFVPQGAPAATLTFVGEVQQDPNLTVAIAVNGKQGFYGSKVPQQGRVVTDLGFDPAEDDFITKWDNAKPNLGGNVGSLSDIAYAYIGGTWFNSQTQNPEEPVIGVAEGFILLRTGATPTTWTRCFNVNTPCASP